MVDLNRKTKGAIDAYRALTKRIIELKRVWSAASLRLCTLKTGNLVWRLLHDKIWTGNQLVSVPEENRKRRPLDGRPLTHNHIWPTCLLMGCRAHTLVIVWRKRDLQKAPPTAYNAGTSPVSESKV